MLLYQTESMNKYSTKRSTHCSSFDTYCRHRRDYSPSSKRRSPIRNGSYDEWSPKVTGGSTSYSTSKYSKNRSDKERDNITNSTTSSRYDSERRRTYRTSRTPDRYESSRSYGKLDKSSRINDYHENSNFSSSSAHGSKKLTEFGEWKEHTSSSGKIYYYNTRTTNSQWDKPKEWIEYERRHSSKYLSDKYYREKYDKYENDSNYPKSYSYSNESSRHPSRYDRSPSYRTKRDAEKRSYDDDRRFYDDDRRSYDDDRRSYDEDKRLSSERSVKRSRHDGSFYKKSEPPPSPLKPTDSQCNIMNNSYNQKYDSRDSDSPKPNSVKNKANDYIQNSTTAATATTVTATTITHESNLSSLTSILSSSGQSSQSLSKIISQLKNHGINLSANYTHEELLVFLKSLSAKSQCTTSNAVINNTNNSSNNVNNSTSNNITNANSTIQSNSLKALSSPQEVLPQNTNVKREIVHQNSLTRNGLNYRNNADGIRQDLDQMSKNMIQSPTSTTATTSTAVTESKIIRTDSNSLAFNSISSAINSVTQKNAMSSLNRFKHLFREDLIQHTTNWPSDQLEEQAWIVFEQVNGFGNRLGKVSMELKKARSLVRLYEVDITLDKQRILFANQQIKLLEDDQGKVTFS